MKSSTVVQILKNLFSSWGTIIIRAGIGLFLVPFIIGRLGKEGYGVVGIIMSTIGFAEIADLGLRAALNRELSEKVADHDQTGFRQLSSTALVLYLGIALFLSAIIVLLAPSICSLYRIDQQYEGISILLLRTYSPVMIILSFVTPVFSAGFASFMRYDIQNNIRTVSQVLTSLLLIIILYLEVGNPILVWCAVMAFGELLQLVVITLFYSRICFGGHLSHKYIHLPGLTPLFKLGGGLYLLQLSNALTAQVTPLLISRYLGIGSVAIYQAGAKLPAMVRPLIMSGVNQLLPLTTKLHVSKNQAREQDALILGTKYTFYLGAIFSAAMIVYADPFCHLWLFDQLGEDAHVVALVLKLLAVITLINSSAGMQWPVAVGKKKVMGVICYHIPTAIMGVVLSVFFVRCTALGIAGVLYGMMITEIVRRPIAAWYVSSRLLGLRIRKYILDAYVAPSVFFFLLLLLGYYLVVWSKIDQWGELVGSGLVFSLVALLLLGGFEWRLVGRLLSKKLR